MSFGDGKKHMSTAGHNLVILALYQAQGAYFELKINTTYGEQKVLPFSLRELDKQMNIHIETTGGWL